MSFIRGGETILVKRRDQLAVDAYGNPTYTLTTITIKDALIGIGTTDEPVDPARDAVDAKVTLYLPNGTQIQDGDVFVVRGSEWLKDGSAEEWISPFPGMETGVVVPLRRRRG
jgi:hypothetical protein